MARTSSSAISNSATKPFSNCQGRITKDNYNRVVAQANIYDILTSLSEKKSLPTNRYPNIKPKSVNQVVLESGLLRL